MWKTTRIGNCGDGEKIAMGPCALRQVQASWSQIGREGESRRAKAGSVTADSRRWPKRANEAFGGNEANRVDSLCLLLKLDESWLGGHCGK